MATDCDIGGIDIIGRQLGCYGWRVEFTYPSGRRLTLPKTRRFPAGEVGWGAAFVQVDEVEHGDGLAVEVFETGLLEAEGDPLAGFVAPPALGHEAVPSLEFLVGKAVAVFIAPVEHLFVGESEEDAVADVGVTDMEEVKTTSVEVDTKVLVVALGEDTLGMEADFIEHPGEVDEAPDGVVGAAGELGGHGFSCGCGNRRGGGGC